MDETAPADTADMADMAAEPVPSGAPPDASLSASPAAPLSSTQPVASRLRQWIGLSRPSTLVLTLAPAVTGLVLIATARQAAMPMYAAFTLIALVLAQSGANLLDAHLEYERGRRSRWDVAVTDSAPRATDEVLARQGRAVLRVGFALMALAICAGLALVTVGGTLELALGAFGLAVAFLYASTTYALKRLAGGELAVFVALGPAIMAATVLAQRQHMTASEFLLGCALGLFGTAVVEVVRLRDAAQPAVLGAAPAPGQSTLALPRIVLAVCVVGAYAMLVVAAVRDVGVVGAVAALLSFPAALRALGAGVRTSSAVVLEGVARQMPSVHVVRDAAGCGCAR